MKNKNQNQSLDFNSNKEEEHNEDLAEGNELDDDDDNPDFDIDDDGEDIDFSEDEDEDEENDLFSEKDGDEEENFTEEGEEEDFTEEGYEDDDDDDFYDDEEGKAFENIVLSKEKAVLVKKLLENIKESNERLIGILGSLVAREDEEKINISQISDNIPADSEKRGNIIEGVFDGEYMIGPDGKQYSVPSNYASKSKLVEGDMLKLTITPKGTFVYKQTKPAERKRLKGKLEQNEASNFIVLAEGKKWKVLTASITYFKGNIGDEVVLLVPRYSNGGWGAVENIIKSK